LLLFLVAGTQIFSVQTNIYAANRVSREALDEQPTPTQTPAPLPTVVIPQSTSITVPTVVIPQPTSTSTPTATPTPTPTPKPKKHRRRAKRVVPVVISRTWIQAYLTSYCPGSAGWLSSSGLPVFYGMLANDYYRFGTRVYIPVIGLTGIVEDRVGAFNMWNHFDVWSPTCFGTPTGWYTVSVQG
jgi:hypothetical protein